MLTTESHTCQEPYTKTFQMTWSLNMCPFFDGKYGLVLDLYVVIVSFKTF
jgi:hypothetical protein